MSSDYRALNARQDTSLNKIPIFNAQLSDILSMAWDPPPIRMCEGSGGVPWVPDEDDMMDEGTEQPDPMADDLGELLGEMNMQGDESDPEMEEDLAGLVGSMALRKRDG